MTLRTQSTVLPLVLWEVLLVLLLLNRCGAKTLLAAGHTARCTIPNLILEPTSAADAGATAATFGGNFSGVVNVMSCTIHVEGDEMLILKLYSGSVRGHPR